MKWCQHKSAFSLKQLGLNSCFVFFLADWFIAYSFQPHWDEHWKHFCPFSTFPSRFHSHQSHQRGQEEDWRPEADLWCRLWSGWLSCECALRAQTVTLNIPQDVSKSSINCNNRLFWRAWDGLKCHYLFIQNMNVSIFPLHTFLSGFQWCYTLVVYILE